jgi:hypothetical protein
MNVSRLEYNNLKVIRTGVSRVFVLFYCRLLSKDLSHNISPTVNDAGDVRTYLEICVNGRN